MLAHFAGKPLRPGFLQRNGGEACNLVIERIPEPISQIDRAERLILRIYIEVTLAVERNPPFPDVLDSPFALKAEVP